MKRYIIAITAVFAVLVSCQKSEEPQASVSETNPIEMTLNVSIASDDTKVTYTDDDNVLRSKDFYESIFGDLNKIKSSDMDPKYLIDNCRDIPDIYMACGVDDFLYGKNVDFHEFLKSREIDATFVEAEGEHNWEFCDKYLKEFIKTLL